MPEQNTQAIPVRTVRIPNEDWEWAGMKAHDLPGGRKTAGRVVRNALSYYREANPLSPKARNQAPLVESSKTGGGEIRPPSAPPSPDSTEIKIDRQPDVEFPVTLT